MESAKRNPFADMASCDLNMRRHKNGVSPDSVLRKSASASSEKNTSAISADSSNAVTPKSKSFEGQHRVTFSESQLECSDQNGVNSRLGDGAGEPASCDSGSHGNVSANCTKVSSPVGTQPKAPILRVHRTPSQHSHDNPFVADGELSQKADYILRHSTISRTQVSITDPDCSVDEPQNDNTNAADVPDGDVTTPIVAEKANGSAEAPLTPQAVEVEVATATTTQAEPQSAERVKLKGDPKCKCCTIL